MLRLVEPDTSAAASLLAGLITPALAIGGYWLILGCGSAPWRAWPFRSRAQCTDLIVHPRFRWQLKQKPVNLRPKLRLPPEVALQVLSFLDARSLCRCTCVSKEWYFLGFADKLWYNLCFNDYAVDLRDCREFAAGVILARTLYQRVSLSHRAVANSSYGIEFLGPGRSPLSLRIPQPG
mmetsp:Transcript_18177/g.46164  ORF Transcript_18177/g.46164 Transcript_18177/m.46164 type:complete len:179 (-) Transcript_18177:835-1371(-)